MADAVNVRLISLRFDFRRNFLLCISSLYSRQFFREANLKEISAREYDCEWALHFAHECDCEWELHLIRSILIIIIMSNAVGNSGRQVDAAPVVPVQIT